MYIIAFSQLRQRLAIMARERTSESPAARRRRGVRVTFFYMTFLTPVKLAVVSLALTFAAPAALASLAPSSLDSLIDDSDLIVEASVKRTERTGVRAGTAILQVRRAFVGDWQSGDLELSWSDEVHDQSIPSLDHDYLLFLKRNGRGGYTSTQYGRSYWRFLVKIVDPTRASLDEPTRAFEYTSPLVLLTMSKDAERRLLKNVESPTSGGKVRAIGLAALVDYIRERKKRPLFQ